MSLKVSTFADMATLFLNDTFSNFKKTITISSLVTVDDGQGGSTTSWSVLSTPEAFIFNSSGDEAEESGRVSTEQMVTFQLKPVTGLDETMKITYNSEDYLILSIDNITEAGVWIKVMAERKSKAL